MNPSRLCNWNVKLPNKRQPFDAGLNVVGVGCANCGDLLTTSPTAGYAMKVTEPAKAFGAVLGKALRKLESGQGLIPILIGLQ